MFIYNFCKIYASLVAFFSNAVATIFSSTVEPRRQIRRRIMSKYALVFSKHLDFSNIDDHDNDIYNRINQNKIHCIMQNITFPDQFKKIEKAIIILIPEHNVISGGIFSIFSIANQLRRWKLKYNYDIILMTRPNANNETYFRNTTFINNENIYRFQQILQMQNLQQLYLHIPEYAITDFYKNLNQNEIQKLSSLKRLDINILNQNIRLMPEPENYEYLRKISHSLTQSVAHHAYFSQKMANYYNLPTLFLPAYTDLTSYEKSDFLQKEKLIIYSYDAAPHRVKCLAILKKNLPDFKFLEIKDITFDVFMDYATRCMFSVSFGEGFDGYIAQPIYQGGIGLTVYNEDFFPSDSFKQYQNFFNSEEDMLQNIIKVIRDLSGNPDKYKKLNQALVAEYNMLYSFDEYVQQVEKLAKKEFEIFPNNNI